MALRKTIIDIPFGGSLSEKVHDHTLTPPSFEKLDNVRASKIGAFETRPGFDALEAAYLRAPGALFELDNRRCMITDSGVATLDSGASQFKRANRYNHGVREVGVELEDLVRRDDGAIFVSTARSPNGYLATCWQTDEQVFVEVIDESTGVSVSAVTPFLAATFRPLIASYGASSFVLLGYAADPTGSGAYVFGINLDTATTKSTGQIVAGEPTQIGGLAFLGNRIASYPNGPAVVLLQRLAPSSFVIRTVRVEAGGPTGALEIASELTLASISEAPLDVTVWDGEAGGDGLALIGRTGATPQGTVESAGFTVAPDGTLTAGTEQVIFDPDDVEGDYYIEPFTGTTARRPGDGKLVALWSGQAHADGGGVLPVTASRWISLLPGGTVDPDTLRPVGLEYNIILAAKSFCPVAGSQSDFDLIFPMAADYGTEGAGAAIAHRLFDSWFNPTGLLCTFGNGRTEIDLPPTVELENWASGTFSRNAPSPGDGSPYGSFFWNGSLLSNWGFDLVRDLGNGVYLEGEVLQYVASTNDATTGGWVDGGTGISRYYGVDTDPLGGTDCSRIVFASGGNLNWTKQVNGVADPDAGRWRISAFVKRFSDPVSLRFFVEDRNGTRHDGSFFSVPDEWGRVEEEITVPNTSGGPDPIYFGLEVTETDTIIIYGFNAVHIDTGAIAPLSSRQVVKTVDPVAAFGDFYKFADQLNYVLTPGFWSSPFQMTIAPEFSSSSPIEGTQPILHSVAGDDWIRLVEGVGATRALEVVVGGVTLLTITGLTWAAEQNLTLLIEPTTGTVTLAGFATGDGEYIASGSFGGFGETVEVGWGSLSTADYFDGFIGNPFGYDPENPPSIVIDQPSPFLRAVAVYQKDSAAPLFPNWRAFNLGGSTIPEYGSESPTVKLADGRYSMSRAAFLQTGVQTEQALTLPPSRTGGLRSIFDMRPEPAAWARADDLAMLAGGYLGVFDGVDDGENHLMTGVTIAGGGFATETSGSDPETDYIWTVCIRWLDRQGRIHRSAPAQTQSYTKPADTIFNDAPGAHSAFFLYPPAFTWLRAVPGTPVYAELYRGAATEGVMRLIGIEPVTDLLSAGSPGVPYYRYAYFTEPYYPDQTPALYTTGGVLENEPAPAPLDFTVDKSRVFVIDSEHPREVYPSKIFAPSEAPEFNANLKVIADEDLVAIATMDDKRILFSRHQIYAMSGTGPDNTGAGSFGPIRRISSDGGCISRASVVESDAGVFFQSQRGLYQITRGLQVQYIGAAVEDAVGSETVQAATLYSRQTEVHFLLESGLSIVYNYGTGSVGEGGFVAGVWTTNTIEAYIEELGATHDIELFGGKLAIALNLEDRVSSLLLEAEHHEGVDITVETPWIKPAGLMQAFGRLWRIAVLGRAIRDVDPAAGTNQPSTLAAFPQLRWSDGAFTRASVASYWDGETLTYYAIDALRQVEVDGVSGVYLEASSRNEVPYSETMIGNWAVTQAAMTGGELGPDGTANATKIEATGAQPLAYLINAMSGPAENAEAVYSIFVRSVSGDSEPFALRLRRRSLGAVQQSFTASADWQRFEITTNVEAGDASNLGVYVIPLVDGDGVIVFGAQLEEGTKASSYIVSDAGTATDRELDDLLYSAPGAADALSGNHRVIFRPLRSLSAEAATLPAVYFGVGFEGIGLDRDAAQLTVSAGGGSSELGPAAYLAGEAVTLDVFPPIGTIISAGLSGGEHVYNGEPYAFTVANWAPLGLASASSAFYLEGWISDIFEDLGSPEKGSLVVELRYNYAEALDDRDVYIFSLDEEATTDPMQLFAHIRRQKCESVKLRIRHLQGGLGGAKVELSGLAMQMGAKHGIYDKGK